MSLVTDLQAQYTQSTGISFKNSDEFIDYIQELIHDTDVNDWDFPGITYDQIIALGNYLAEHQTPLV